MKYFVLSLAVSLCVPVFTGCDDSSKKSDTDTDTGTEVELGNPPEAGGEELSVVVENFELKSSLLVDADGEEIASADFSPEDWYPVKALTTVLKGLVANDVYPDPYVGLNNLLIPDSNDAFNEDNDLLQFSHIEGENPWRDPYYFRAELELPSEFDGKRIWLTFEGINYRADVWLNGEQVADSETLVGMFEAFKLDVTDQANPGGDNVLAIAIHPVDDPGLPAAPPTSPEGNHGDNCGEDSAIAKNVTAQYTLGWDWTPAVRDRNMGLWQDVVFSATDAVDVRNPFVETDLPLPDVDTADVTVSAEVVNATDAAVAGALWAQISPANFEGELAIEIGQMVSLEPGETQTVTFSPEDFDELTLEDPALWWPAQYGDPNLYQLSLTFVVDGEVSDAETIRFGVRELETKSIEEIEWRRDFYLNGRPIEVRGGTWVPDLLLDRDRERYETELLYCKEMHLDTIRVWGGGVCPPDEFFELADEIGVMVWQDFFVTGDGQGLWQQGDQDWPLEGDVFLSNVESVIKRIRHHPSLVLYTGGNEGHAREELYTGMRAMAIDLDGTRPFLPSTGNINIPESWGLSYPDDRPSGTYSGHPHWWVPEENYFHYARAAGEWLFNNEVGVGAIPPMRSLEAFILDLSADETSPQYPLNGEWAYHDAVDAGWANETEGQMWTAYDEAIRERYGAPVDVADYVIKGQIVGANSVRAMYEAANVEIERTAGLLIWKINSSWPSVIWQLYDWYLRPNASYYAVRRANELVHILYNAENERVHVVNRLTEDLEGLTAEVVLMDGDLAEVEAYSETIDVAAGGMTEVGLLDSPNETGLIYFAKLRLLDSDDEVLSENLYWMARGDDFTPLSLLSEVDLDVSADTDTADGMITVTVDVENPGDELAFFANLVLLDGAGGKEVLPTFWSDNYFSLFPGESKTIQAVIREDDIDDTPHISVEGWNIAPEELAF